MGSEETENILISIIESSEDAIIGMNRDRIILTWNDSATRLYKYRKEEILGKSAKILYPPDRQEEMEFLRNKVLSGERVNHFETKRVAKGGQIIDISLTISPIKDKQGQIIGISTISCDISEKKQIEETKHRLSLLNQAILDNSYYMIIAVDKNGVIQTFNRAAEKLTGYQASEVIGKTTPMIFHDLNEVEARAAKLTKEFGKPITGFDVFVAKADLGQFEENEWTYIRKDGTRFPVILVPTAIRNEQGVIEGYFGILKDISEKKNLEYALEQNEKRFRTLIDNALDSVITIDGKGIIQSFSLSSEKIFKYSPKEMIGKNIRQLIEDGEADELLSFLKTDDPNFNGISQEINCKRRNGFAFPAEVSINKMIIEGSSWYIWITRDITERKKLDRMKREFISTVSHELRTPLTSIKGALALIASGKTGSVAPQAQKLLEIALRNSDRLVRLINDILDMEKIETGNLLYNIDKHDLIPLIKASVEINQPMAQQFDVKLVFNHADQQYFVALDPDRLIQVITNLLSNAIKYSPKGAEVIISVAKMQEMIRVSISDKGPGIPSKFNSRIFQKFAQLDSSDQRQKGGTGLGLNISKSIIEKFGGSIGFNSQEGKGSTFFFDLAVCPVEEAHAQINKVLICENDPDAASILKTILNASDISAVISYTAENAKERLSKEQFSALLLDIVLPGQDGLSLLNEMRKSTLANPLPIIVISAKEMPKETITESPSFPIIDWLKKPLDAEKLKKILEKFRPHITKQKKKILHVEDDVDLCRIVGIVLEDLAEIEFAHTVSDAKEKISKSHYDLILLDLNLPDGSGLSLVRSLSQIHTQTPVIIFAAADIKETIDDTGHVRSTLIKSKTTNEQLRREIKDLIDTQDTPIQPEHQHEH